MAVLTTEQKRFIVQALARFNTPTEVAELVEERFDIETDRTQVAYYDPETKATGTPADRWKQLYHQARKEYVENVAAVPIAHEAVRFRTLQKVVSEALEEGDHDTVLQAVKQAAKEAGGKFTNKKLLEHSGEVDTGGVLAVPVTADEDSWSDMVEHHRERIGNGASDGKQNGDRRV